MFHIATIDLLYLLPTILYLPPQHGGEYHLDIRPKRIVVEVVAVDADLVGEDDMVVVLHCISLRIESIIFFFRNVNSYYSPNSIGSSNSFFPQVFNIISHAVFSISTKSYQSER